MAKVSKSNLLPYLLIKLMKSSISLEGIISCCTWDGCNGDANKATRTRSEYEKHLLEKTEKFEKFSLQTTSNKNQKLAVFFERRSPTYFPTVSTSKPDDDYDPGKALKW
jgi:hypothetical protein